MRSSGDMVFIRALPPTFPPSLPNATAAGFFFFATFGFYQSFRMLMLDKRAYVRHDKLYMTIAVVIRI